MSKERIILPVNREAFLENNEFGFDHDGVMASSRQSVVEEYNKIYGTNRSTEEIKGYLVLTEWAKEDLGVCDEEAMEIHDYLWYGRPDILLRAEPMPGAEALTKELTQKGKNIQIITSRPPSFRDSTLEWYRVNMPWISRDQINIRTNEEMIGEVFKAWTINRTGVEVFFEDAIHHAKSITTYTNALVILLNNGPIFSIPNRDRVIKITSLVNSIPNLQEAQNALFRA